MPVTHIMKNGHVVIVASYDGESCEVPANVQRFIYNEIRNRKMGDRLTSVQVRRDYMDEAVLIPRILSRITNYIDEQQGKNKSGVEGHHWKAVGADITNSGPPHTSQSASFHSSHFYSPLRHETHPSQTTSSSSHHRHRSPSPQAIEAHSFHTNPSYTHLREPYVPPEKNESRPSQSTSSTYVQSSQLLLAKAGHYEIDASAYSQPTSSGHGTIVPAPAQQPSQITHVQSTSNNPRIPKGYHESRRKPGWEVEAERKAASEGTPSASINPSVCPKGYHESRRKPGWEVEAERKAASEGTLSASIIPPVYPKGYHDHNRVRAWEKDKKQLDR